MFKWASIALFFSIPWMALGCSSFEESIVGSGTLKTIQHPAQSFDKLRISHFFHVTLKQGKAFSIQVQIDEKAEPYLIMAQTNKRLILGFTPNYRYVNIVAKASITMPTVQEINLSGSAQLTGGQFTNLKSLNLTTSGASRLTLNNITSTDVFITGSGSSQHVLHDGSASNVFIAGSGSSSYTLLSFPVESADIKLSGSSQGELHVHHKIKYSLSGSSQLKYKGTPNVIEQKTTGSSSVKKLP